MHEALAPLEQDRAHARPLGTQARREVRAPRTVESAEVERAWNAVANRVAKLADKTRILDKERATLLREPAYEDPGHARSYRPWAEQPTSRRDRGGE